jgi:hypothetical protein
MGGNRKHNTFSGLTTLYLPMVEGADETLDNAGFDI